MNYDIDKITKAKDEYNKTSINFSYDRKLEILTRLQERAEFFGKSRINEMTKFNFISVLDDLVKQNLIDDYVLGGAAALLYYTSPSFYTEDIDIFISIKKQSSIFDLSDIYYYLQKEYSAKVEREWIIIKENPIQFLMPGNNLQQEAFDTAKVKTISEKQIKIFSLEYLIAIMLWLNKSKYTRRLLLVIEENQYNKHDLMIILKKYNLADKWERLVEFQNNI
ncbi:MAG: hypothetical protein LBT84_07355 [Spirochaetia bacterium]|jgi:hypothetical protein|nr:hypothetical protein [Spirochaetia bacterium]